MNANDLSPFCLPGTPGYDDACRSFQLAATVDPAGAFVAHSIEDVVQGISVARREGLPLRVSTTGHSMGATAPVTGSLLMNPQIDAEIRVDPLTRTARVPAGARWADVVAAAVPHALTTVHGSSGTIGVVGFLLGGGISFYGRQFGVGANLLRSITLVLADGEVTTVSAEANPELFWGLRGGGGGFGVVVEVEINLIPMHRVLTGMTVWDAADASRIAPAWQNWAATAPPEVTTSLRLLNIPPLPTMPPQLAGRHVLVIDGAVTATTEADIPQTERIAAEFLTPLTELAAPIMSTWALTSPEALPLTHMDPTEPLPFQSDTALLDAIDAEDWPSLLKAAGVGSSTSLLVVEFRQLGGSFAEPKAEGGAFSAIAAPLLYWACGLPGGGSAHDLAQIRQALLPYRNGLTAPTFADHFDKEQRTYDNATRARVERIRAATDPEGLFAGGVSAIRD